MLRAYFNAFCNTLNKNINISEIWNKAWYMLLKKILSNTQTRRSFHLKRILQLATSDIFPFFLFYYYYKHNNSRQSSGWRLKPCDSQTVELKRILFQHWSVPLELSGLNHSPHGLSSITYGPCSSCFHSLDENSIFPYFPDNKPFHNVASDFQFALILSVYYSRWPEVAAASTVYNHPAACRNHWQQLFIWSAS